MLKKVHGYENGIELQFSSRLIGEETSQAKNYFIQQWNYEYSAMVPLSIRLSVLLRRARPCSREKCRILPDQKSVFLRF